MIEAPLYYPNKYGDSEIKIVKGEKQPNRFNDVFWALLFYSHLAAMVYLACRYIPQMNNENVGRRLGIYSNRFLQENSDPNSLFLLIGLSIIGGFILAICSLTFMIKFASVLIKAGLVFNMFLGLAASVAGFASGSLEAGIVGLFFFILTSCYAYYVWERIEFAATNLVTASTAIKSNFGVTVYAYLAILLNGLWILFWTATVYSTLTVVNGCDAGDADYYCELTPNGFVVFLLLLSLFWTFQIIKNVVHVTVAGAVGSWWWAPQTTSCCSKAVRDSNIRAITYSFGSICLGSLVVAIIQTIKQILENARQSDDGLLRCLADCCLGCVESLVEMFNEWAFIYVGIYGYSFVSSAKSVIQLFKHRGWSAIITDYLVDRVLAMISIGNGLIVGGLSALLSYCLQLNLEGTAFTLGFLIGILLSSVLLSVVGSAVNTVIVCFAEDPAAFETNHHELSVKMLESWRSAYPDHFNY